MQSRKRPEKPRKSPTQERSRSTVEAILQAATYILVERGWDALTTNGIARRAGVNIASLYQYFPDKRTIVAELERRHVLEARALVADVLMRHRGGGLADRARTLVDAAIAAHSVAPELHRIFAEEIPRARGLEAELPIPREIAVSQLSELGMPNPDLASWIIAVVVHAVVHQSIMDRPADFKSGDLANELVRLLVRYVRPE